MIRKLVCLMAALLLLPVFPAAAEETAPVTAAELDALLAALRGEILAEPPLNNPADESAQSEDGTLFQYDNAALFAEGTEMTADTPVNTILFADSEGPVFRGTGVDTRLEDLLAAFPLDNAGLAGTRDSAVLYLRQTEGAGFVYGLVLRDGQRITFAEYGEILPAGGAFRRVSVTYALQDGLVVSIRADGLNPETSAVDAGQAEELFSDLTALSRKDEYRAVKTSRNGLELTAFGEEDLVFSGISYTALTPDTLPGAPERELIDNEDGTWLLRCDGNGYEAVFSCDAEGRNTRILSYSILDGETEGPRGVRLGDRLSEDLCRFRNGENEMGEDMTELLYGTEGTAPWGWAVYDLPEPGLRYAAALADGTTVELLLKYDGNLLSEITLRSVQ